MKNTFNKRLESTTRYYLLNSRASSNAKCHKLLPSKSKPCRLDDVMSKHDLQFHFYEKQVIYCILYIIYVYNPLCYV